MPKKNAGKEQKGGNSFRQELLADDTYKKYRRILKAMQERLDLDKIAEEAQALFSGRLSRGLKGTIPGSDKLVKAVTQDSAYRSRLTELLVQLRKEHDLLEIALDAVKVHMHTEFTDRLSDFKTKGERDNYVNRHVRSGVEYKAQMASLSDRLNLYVKDIDQSQWSIKAIIDCLQITVGNKVGVV